MLPQHHRLASLHQFKSQSVPVLVATDVASRGLDVPTVDLVVNETLPTNPTSYVHRAGRTARAGRRGHCLSLVGPEDVRHVHAVEGLTGAKLEADKVVLDKHVTPLLSSVAKVREGGGRRRGRSKGGRLPEHVSLTRRFAPR